MCFANFSPFANFTGYSQIRPSLVINPCWRQNNIGVISFLNDPLVDLTYGDPN